MLRPHTMSNFIVLPDSTLLNLNGAALGEFYIKINCRGGGVDASFLFSTGTAGYGNNTWAIGQSYADDPVLTPAIYNPFAAPGQRWSSNNLSASTVPRLYHSSATLLPDGNFSTSCLLLASSLTLEHL